MVTGGQAVSTARALLTLFFVKPTKQGLRKYVFIVFHLKENRDFITSIISTVSGDKIALPLQHAKERQREGKSRRQRERE